jgi:hypothetical protein
MSANTDRFRAAVELFNEHGVGLLEDENLRPLLADWLDPEIECFSDNPLQSGTYRGFDGYERFVREWNEAWEKPHWEIDELVERGDGIAAAIRHSAQGSVSGAGVDMLIGFFLLSRDGRLARWEIYGDPADALARLEGLD